MNDVVWFHLLYVVYFSQGAKITYEREANLVIDYSSLGRSLKQVRPDTLGRVCFSSREIKENH